DHIEARLERYLRGPREIIDGSLDLVARHRPRRRIVAEGDVAGAERLPSALIQGERLSAEPWLVAGSLAARMRDLDRGHRTVVGKESRDRRPRARMRLRPDPRVPGCDTAFGSDAARLHAHHRRAADRAAAEVHEVPFVGHAVLARVHAHGRD